MKQTKKSMNNSIKPKENWMYISDKTNKNCAKIISHWKVKRLLCNSKKILIKITKSENNYKRININQNKYFKEHN